MEHNAILDSRLSLSSNIPLYAQLVGIIKREISSGALKIGDLLPSEAELCRALDISRNTARQAIGELEDEGLVVRKRGKGTFVADPNSNRRGVRYSFTTEVSSLGKTPSSTLVDFGVVIPTRAICQRMDLQEGTHVYCFTRIRNVDGAADPGNLLLSPVHLSQSHPGDGPDPQLLQSAVPCGHHTVFRRGYL